MSASEDRRWCQGLRSENQRVPGRISAVRDDLVRVARLAGFKAFKGLGPARQSGVCSGCKHRYWVLLARGHTECAAAGADGRGCQQVADRVRPRPHGTIHQRCHPQRACNPFRLQARVLSSARWGAERSRVSQRLSLAAAGSLSLRGGRGLVSPLEVLTHTHTHTQLPT